MPARTCRFKRGMLGRKEKCRFDVHNCMGMSLKSPYLQVARTAHKPLLAALILNAPAV